MANDGGQVFPVIQLENYCLIKKSGMSVRTHVACEALKSIILKQTSTCSESDSVEQAFVYADEFIKQMEGK